MRGLSVRVMGFDLNGTWYVCSNGFGTRVVLDSISMAEVFCAGHETAKADRDILWLRTSSDQFTMQMLVEKERIL